MSQHHEEEEADEPALKGERHSTYYQHRVALEFITGLWITAVFLCRALTCQLQGPTLPSSTWKKECHQVKLVA